MMKLISCHIENFGSIRNQTFTFREGLTAVCAENGSGKTTLADFLEAMLYGMKLDRTNSREFGARRHYLPFGGGKFGGSLLFSVGEDVYKIERTFDEKSETKDAIAVYKNDEQFGGFGKNIGEAIFGIDRESFKRTALIDAESIEFGSTGSINAKLHHIAAGSTDAANAETAAALLEKKAKGYKKERADSSSLTAREKAALHELRIKIGSAETTKESLPALYAQLDGLEGELGAARAKQKALQGAALIRKDWERYDGYLNSAAKSEQELDELAQTYPHGLPSLDEVTKVRDRLTAKQTLQDQHDKLMSAEDAEKLAALRKKYAGGAPTEEELNGLSAKIGQLTTAEADLRAAENVQPSAQESALRARFDGHSPTQAELEDLEAAADAYERAEKAYSVMPDLRAAPQRGAGAGRKTGYLVCATLSAAAAAAGIGVLFVQPIAGIALLAAGLLCLIGTGFLYLNKKASAPPTAQQIDPEKIEKRKEMAAAEAKVRHIAAQYGYTDDRGVRDTARKLKEDFEAYQNLRKEGEERNKKLREKRQARDGLRGELEKAFAARGFTEGDFGDRLTALQRELSDYSSLTKTESNLRQQNEKAQQQIEEHEEKIAAFCEKYGLVAGTLGADIDRIESDAQRGAQARRERADNLEKAEAFKQEKGLTDRPAAADGEEGTIEEEIDRLQRERASLTRKIGECEEVAEGLDDLYAERQRREEALARYEHTYAILTRTGDLLRQADKQLKDKYITPVRQHFSEYAALLEAALGEQLTMTPDFTVRFEQNGAAHSDQHLSAGQRSLCAFCFRMALLENMYPGEKPFLILDDPFVHLDKTHMDRVKELLQTLSEKWQLLYFTCHESRAM